MSLNNYLNEILEALDKASEEFCVVVLPFDEISQAQPESELADKVVPELKQYALMSSYLIQHPLLEVIKKIRDEQVVDENDSFLQVVKRNVKAGQAYKHYKGDVYRVKSVSRNANTPMILMVTYYNPLHPEDLWTLDIGEFCKKVVNEKGERVNRFTLQTTK